VDTDGELAMWVKEAEADQQLAKADATLLIFNASNPEVPVKSYMFTNAWPCNYKASGVTSGGNEILMETVEIAHEGMTVMPI
jgi:phage tail-like protein